MISVAMATYNGSEFIKEQLMSIANQTVLPDEIVIVDDCSTDNTVEIIENFVAAISGIKCKLIKNEINLGFVKTFFKAIRECENEIIVLCDQDDLWKKNRIEWIEQLFESNSKILSVNSDYDIIDKEGNIILKKVQGYRNCIKAVGFVKFLARLNYSGMSSAFRKSIIKNFSDEIVGELPTHDWYIHAVAASLGGFYISNEVTCMRRFTGRNVALRMANGKKTLKDRIENVKAHITFYEVMQKCGVLFVSRVCAKTIRKKIAVEYRRKEYLEERSLWKWLIAIINLKYYAKLKSYLGDAKYIICEKLIKDEWRIEREDMPDLIKFIKKPSRIIIALGSRWPGIIKDETYLRVAFTEKVGYSPNFDHPKSFNEKIQWLKMHDHNPTYIKMVDKVEVKEWVSNRIGSDHVITTLGIWNSFDDIDFGILPYKFVLKCTHDSGGVYICKDKDRMDYSELKRIFKPKLNHNFYGYGREWPYKMIKPRMMAEEFIQTNSTENNGILMDYKLMCFNGKVRCIFVCTGRYSNEGLHVTFFDDNWNRLPFERKYPSSKEDLDKPKNLDLMLKIARKLSYGIPFVRVDLYEVNNRVYFGEMTFYPGSGFEPFYPIEWDYKLGKWIDCSDLEGSRC